MKKTLTLVVVLLLILGLTACNVQTESQQQQPAPAPSGGETPTEGGGAVTVERVPLRLLYMSYQEPVVNVVQDMLNKNGFDVTLNTQPDYASFKAQEDAGNYDISMSGWTTVTGNPDYAVRSLFITGGDYSKLADPALDALIDQAALETADVYVDTYKQFEKVLVEDNAYIIPLYTGIKAQAFNETMLKADSVRLSKSRAFVWEEVEYNDASLHETRPLVLQQMLGSLTSLDPIKGNDGSINQLNTNMYVRLVNLTDDDQVVSRSSLSYNHAIAEGNSEYYFLLRDDAIRFCEEGRRLRPATLSRAKALLPFCGVPLLELTASMLSSLPVDNMVVNCCYQADRVSEFCARLAHTWIPSARTR